MADDLILPLCTLAWSQEYLLTGLDTGQMLQPAPCHQGHSWELQTELELRSHKQNCDLPGPYYIFVDVSSYPPHS